MEERATYALAGEWAQAHRGRAAGQAHELTHLLAAALSTVPDGMPWALQVGERELSRLLLLGDGHLWRLTVIPDDQGESDGGEAMTEYVTLARETCRLAVSQRWGHGPSGGVVPQGFWLRTYRLQVFHAGAEPFEVSVEGRETVQGGWSGHPRLDREEIFGRALAAALGWQTETPE